MHKENDLIELRKKAVRALSTAEDQKQYIQSNAETLFGLDLTMYTKNYTLNSLFYNAISSSKLLRRLFCKCMNEEDPNSCVNVMYSNLFLR